MVDIVNYEETRYILNISSKYWRIEEKKTRANTHKQWYNEMNEHFILKIIISK